ncbi:MAG TPA: acetyltransferase [Hymenobacter sp.]|jgi:sugar O-acyltransferase (sialic acid O-acetyltransferase NeuD family)
MLIIGAKGFAKEVLEVICQADRQINLAFYDDVTSNFPLMLYDEFPVLQTLAEAEQWFAKDNRFVLGIGNPKVRRALAEKLKRIGGQLTSTISPKANVGIFGNHIGVGCNIMTGAVLTSDITLGEGVLINLNCTIGHDCVIHSYCELSPGVHISGHVELGENCVIGTGAVILPGVKIGVNSIIGAGSVVNKDVGDNVVAVGVPAKIIKSLIPA